MNRGHTSEKSIKFLTGAKFITLIIGIIIMQACSNGELKQVRNSIFIEFHEDLHKLSSPAARQAAADNLISRVKKSAYPIYENDTTVVLLYQSDADSAFILGDMGHWQKHLPMTKIADTELFFVRGHYPQSARLEYLIMTEKGGMGGSDPLNPYKVLNGFGPMSELAMPGYERHPYFETWQFGNKGDTSLVESRTIPEGILPYEHQLHVYLPPDYQQSDRLYPVVYFQDGLDYIEFAIAPHVIDQLIKDRKIEPLIAVFVTPPNRFQAEMPNRMTEYGLNDDYVQFFIDELVPFIDERYRTRTNPQSRLVVGDSFGGLISAYIPFKRPDVFGQVYPQSAYVSFQKDKLIKLYEAAERKPIRLYVDVGHYERAVGANFLPDDEIDFLEGNRRFREVLEKKDYDFVYREYYEGHTWGNWRRHLIDGLIHFFGIKKG